MTITNPIDTGFAPWSLMTPDAGVSKRGEQPAVQEARLHLRDDRSYHAKPDDGSFFGDDGVSFGDFLDMINPLHHLPVVGPIYRSLTGDEIDPGAKVAGSALYGGPIGMVAGAMNAMIEESSGDDLGGQALAFLFGGDDADTAVAAGAAPPVEVAELPAGSDVNPPLDLAALSGFTTGTANAAANTGAIEPTRMPAARYGGVTADTGNAPDIAAAMFAANGNATAAANVAAFNQTAFRRSDLAATDPQNAAQQATASTSGGATRISQRMADHLAMLAGQTQSQPMPQAMTAAADPVAPPPRTISGPLPQAFSDTAPEGNPFADAAPAPETMQTASLSGLTLAGEAVGAGEMQDAISQSGTAAVGYTNPGDIARAMKTAIERYEQQRAAQQG